MYGLMACPGGGQRAYLSLPDAGPPHVVQFGAHVHVHRAVVPQLFGERGQTAEGGRLGAAVPVNMER